MKTNITLLAKAFAKTTLPKYMREREALDRVSRRQNVSDYVTKRRVQQISISNCIEGGLRITFKDRAIERPTSWTNQTSCLSTNVFKTSTVSGLGILSAKAANTSPLSFQTTMPIPTTLISTNIAPSKLVLMRLGSSGFHTRFFFQAFFLGIGQKLWNCWRCFWAESVTLFNGCTGSPTVSLFLLVQITQHVMAKRSKIKLELRNNFSGLYKFMRHNCGCNAQFGAAFLFF